MFVCVSDTLCVALVFCVGAGFIFASVDVLCEPVSDGSGLVVHVGIHVVWVSACGIMLCAQSCCVASVKFEVSVLSVCFFSFFKCFLFFTCVRVPCFGRQHA